MERNLLLVVGSSFLRRIFRAFRHRDFRLMWIGACVSTTGTFVQQFAQSWLVYDLTKNPFYLGLDLFLGQLPIMLFSLFGGVFADRMDRRKMLLYSQYIQMTCAFVLAGLFANHTLKGMAFIAVILSLSFIVGCGQSFGGPAYSALLPALVKGEDLSNAIAMNSIQFNLARVLGPALGGLAYTTLGATWCFTLNGVSYIAVILSLFMIQVKFVPPRSRESILKSMGEGIRFIRQREGLGPLVVLAFFTTLLGFSITGFLPVIVQAVFHRGPETYQVLSGIFRRGIGHRRVHRGRHGALEGTRPCGTASPSRPRSYDRRVRPFPLASAFLHPDLRRRSSHHGVGLTHALAGASDRLRPDAGPGNERLQSRLPCRNSTGEPGAGKADPHGGHFLGAGRVGRNTHRAFAVFPYRHEKYPDLPTGSQDRTLRSGNELDRSWQPRATGLWASWPNRTRHGPVDKGTDFM